MKRLQNYGWFPVYNHNSTIDMNVLIIIPFVLYFSKSVIENPNKDTHGALLFSIHITPFLSFGFTWRNS